MPAESWLRPAEDWPWVLCPIEPIRQSALNRVNQSDADFIVFDAMFEVFDAPFQRFESYSLSF